MAETYQYPNIYVITDIFDPDTNPTGRVIPAVGSIVVDVVNDGRTYYVESVDPTTNKSTLEPIKASIVALSSSEDYDLNITSIINYGNARFYAYINRNTQPTRITIDKRIVVFGKNNRYYRLIKMSISNPNQYDVVSANYSSSGDYLGEYIPLVDIDTNGYMKYCHDCYTNFNIDDNELITLEVYDYNKTLTYSVTLFTKSTDGLVLTTEPRIIVGFELECTQEIDNNTFYVYPQQDLSRLGLTPRLILNDGTNLPISIDNTKCFLYGLDDFQPSFPGQETTLVCKYYLSSNEVADPSIAYNNMIVIEKTLKVVNDESDTYRLKISVIPRYDPVNSKYVMFYYLYVLGDNSVRDVTPLVTVTEPFDYRYYDGYQLLNFRLELQDVFPNLSEPEYHIQSILVKLNPPTYYEKYILRDNENDDYGIYGVEGGDRHRPIIHCDTINNNYRILTSLFTDVNKFLDEFYYRARPLYDTSQYQEPIRPTHFTIRDVITNQLLLSSPIDVNQYSNTFTLTTTTPIYNTNVIVEMLFHNDDGTFTTLYGVPVDIIPL